MKSFLSLPTNGDFFARYANLVPTLFKVGILSQVVSGLTEIGIIFSIAYGSLYAFFPSYVSVPLAVFCAIIGTALIELGLRKFIPYSIKAFLYKRFTGLDLAMTIFILITTLALLSVSGNLSFRNSVNIVEMFKPQADTKDRTPVTNEYEKERGQILATYSTDSSSIASVYNTQINAKNTEYQSLIDIQKQGIARYERKEQRERKSYRTKKIVIQTKIEQLEADRDAKTSILITSKGNELKSLLEAKNVEIKGIKKDYKTKASSIESHNDTAVEKRDKKIASYGLGLGWFTIFGLFVFVLSVILDEIHKKGSGIEEKILVSQNYFSDNIVNAFFNMVGNKIQFAMRKKINEWESTTPPPPLPNNPMALYDVSNLEQEKITINVKELPKDGKVVYLPNGTNDFRNYENRSDTGKLRNCQHCNNEYTYNHKKQKYCSDNCRVKAWEKRKGKTLQKRKANVTK